MTVSTPVSIPDVETLLGHPEDFYPRCELVDDDDQECGGRARWVLRVWCPAVRDTEQLLVCDACRDALVNSGGLMLIPGHRIESWRAL